MVHQMCNGSCIRTCSPTLDTCLMTSAETCGMALSHAACCMAVRSMTVSEGGAPLARLSDGTVWLLHGQLRAWVLVAGRESPAAAFASLVDPTIGGGLPALSYTSHPKRCMLHRLHDPGCPLHLV